jgi:tRNA threonylcarbamoyladenosine biosynthesis protein TsaB
MNLLAIDTSLDGCSVALSVGDQLYSRFELLPRAQAQHILPLIDAVLHDANLTLRDINAFAYGAGPGSFTGLRLASAVVQGFGLVFPVPITPISTLAAIAQTVLMQQGATHCLVAVDARMGEIYSGFYVCNDEEIMIATGAEHILKPTALIVPEDGDWAGAGDAFVTMPEAMAPIRAQCQGCVTSGFPAPQALIALAKYQLKNNLIQSASDVEPVYLRTPHYVKAQA